jgi:hypothetical protein
MANQGISLREAARQLGCTHPSLTNAINNGKLTTYPDGSVDLAEVKEWWAGHTPTRRGRPPKGSKAPVSSPDSPGPVEELLETRGLFKDRAAAELHRATYAALSEELDYELKAGAIVEIEEIARAVGNEYATVRQKLLAIPAEQAPRLFARATVLQLQDSLLELVTEALTSLTIDTPK